MFKTRTNKGTLTHFRIKIDDTTALCGQIPESGWTEEPGRRTCENCYNSAKLLNLLEPDAEFVLDVCPQDPAIWDDMMREYGHDMWEYKYCRIMRHVCKKLPLYSEDFKKWSIDKIKEILTINIQKAGQSGLWIKFCMEQTPSKKQIEWLETSYNNLLKRYRKQCWNDAEDK